MEGFFRHPLAPRIGSAALAFALAAAVGGCGRDSDVIARVGSRTVTVADYRSAASEATFRYPGPADSAKAKVIEDLVRQKLFLEYGFQSGILVDSMAERDYLHMQDQMLRPALIGRLVPSSVPVSGAEVRRFWERRDSSSRCQLVYVTSSDMIEAAVADLARGADFGSVANRYNTTGMLPPEGDIGWVTPGSLVDPLDRMMRETAPGRIAGPVRAPGEGWFLLKVVDRRRSQRDSFHLEAPQLEQALSQRKRRLLSARAFETLRDQYRVTLEPGGMHALYGYFNQPGSVGMPDPNPTPEKLSQVLARYDGGGGHTGIFTLGDALQDLEAGEGERPNPSMLSTFGPWIESRVVERTVLIEARRRRLQEEPALARELEARFESELMNSVFNLGVAPTAQPTEGDFRAAFERDRKPEDPPFEALDDARRQSLLSGAIDLARMRRFIELSDSLRAAIPVTVNSAVVERLPWPVTAAP